MKDCKALERCLDFLPQGLQIMPGHQSGRSSLLPKAKLQRQTGARHPTCTYDMGHPKMSTRSSSFEGQGYTAANIIFTPTQVLAVGRGTPPPRMISPPARVLGVPSNSTLSRDPDLSRKPPETQEKRLRFLERTMVKKNGKGLNP